MTVHEPHQITTAFAEAYNTGEVENLLELYEPEAVLAVAPGERAQGRDQLRAALLQSLEFGGVMQARNHYCLRSGDIALVQGEWTVRSERDGVVLTLSSRTAEVVRRQPDGRWLYLLDHAFADDDALVEPEVEMIDGGAR